MKNSVLIFAVVIGAILLCACSNKETFGCEPESELLFQSRAVGTNYVYPIRPGTDEWSALETHEEKLRVTQLPDDLLNKLRTDELLEVCMDYPLLIDAFLFNTFEEGLEKMCGRFNGFQEFMRRNDNAQVLSIYLERKSNLARIAKVKRQKLDLTLDVAVGLMQLEAVKRNADISAISVAELAITDLVEEGLLLSRKQTSSSVKAAYVGVCTPLGTSWQTISRSEEYTLEDKEDKKKYISEIYPRAIYIDEATTSYNCHAYAWYIWEGNTTKVWLNSNVSSTGLTLPPLVDGSYKQTSSAPDRKIVYFDETGAAHSGIVYQNTGWVVSKWGPECLMRHPIKDCPYDASNVKYYESNLRITGSTSLENKGQYVEADYIVEGGSPNASVSMSVSEAAQIIGNLQRGGIRVRASNSFSVSVAYSMNGTKFRIPSAYVDVWRKLRIKEVTSFQYGQTGYEYTLRVKFEGADEAVGYWSTKNPNVTLSDVQFPGDAIYMEPNCFYKVVSLPGPGTYTVEVYPMSQEAVGTTVAITIDASSGHVLF
ncbi:hypothetical protein [Paramuribaculum intestinale]|uniref:hypothetical protein n=1 Tax=Paramuribaculum intestinale TaxID=2094151 RepID=UPI00272C7C35|nr:hypothetical protein [Paramuribaculum intestinale]